MNLLYGLGFILVLTLQTGAVASLPEPWRFFPLGLIVGVVLLHERSVVLGAVWLSMFGLVLEVRGLGAGLGFAGVCSAAIASALVIGVFAKRSFWALLSVAGITAITFVLARLVWLGGLSILTEQTFGLGELFKQGLSTVLMAIIGIVIFGAYLRRLIKWSRDKFVRKGQLYDISLPQ